MKALLMHPYRMYQLVFIAICLTGLVTPEEGMQKTLPILAIKNLEVSQFIVRMEIGTLVSG